MRTSVLLRTLARGSAAPASSPSCRGVAGARRCSAAVAKTSSKQRSAALRVVTYNVLNPQLCSPESHPHCEAAALDPELRYRRVLAQLEAARHGAPGPAVVLCLQEVNEAWASRLHVHFQRMGYHMIYAPTPWSVYDPMGVCLAWPNAAFELEEAEICRVFPYVPPAAPSAAGARWLSRARAMVEEWLPWRAGGGSASSPMSAEELAGRRPNRYACARLRFRCSGQSVCVGTYHMPALFGSALNEEVMRLHAAAVLGLAQRFAERSPQRAPLVLAGDFNVQPDGAVYELLTRGSGLRSAYAEALGAEPSHTISAWRSDVAEPFIGTLDYILVAKGLSVRGVRLLPSVADGRPLPSLAEPSDHLLLAADLELADAA
eukprot:TRINITY_DN36982_c0_g1_i1.p1 TRINITY_DN36982_c0_g1~~TRINITY_DN36982_c0_g1_i1.p1  ORF type:complete len:375 (-),score=93.10 TRINITY_DN36982_c0_g1_i1:63-1187(-)